MSFSKKIDDFYLDVLAHHQDISTEFSNASHNISTLMYLVQYHCIVEGFCKRMLDYFREHIHYAIQKDFKRYQNIAIIFFRNQNRSGNSIKDSDFLLTDINEQWIEERIKEYDLLNNFKLQKGEFKFLFSFFAPKQYSYQNVLEKKYNDFLEYVDNLHLWRNDIVHDYFQKFSVPSIPKSLKEILDEPEKRKEISKDNENLIRFIYTALKEETT